LAYKTGNREQITILPPTIEGYVGEQDPVRVYGAFVEALHKPAQEDPFGKDKFQYDEKNNQYMCPEGKVLRFSHYSKIRDIICTG
jgi:hypothetical protein